MTKRLCIGVALVLLVIGRVPAAAQKKPSFYVLNSSATDQPTKPGEASSEAAAAATAMKDFVAIALDEQYPCATQITDDDARALLGHARNRDVLGNPDPNALATVAGAVGSDYVVSVKVTQLGGNFMVSTVTFNARTGKVISRSDKTIKADENAIDAMESMAKDVVQGLAGPKCPSNNWSGTVNVSMEGSESRLTPAGDPATANGSMQVNCRLDGTSSLATCDVTMASAIKGKEGSAEQQGHGTVSCTIDVGVGDGRVKLKFGTFKIRVSTQARGAHGSGSTTDDEQSGGWEFEGAAQSNSGKQTGGTTLGPYKVTWNLTPPPGAR
jgi:hypothetical protein